MTAFLSANSVLGLIAETTRGTTPTTGTPLFIPTSAPQVTPNQKFLRDEAFRGSANLVYDQVQGVRSDDVDFKTYLFADTFPILARAILGSADIKTGTGPYTHSTPLAYAPTTGSQPPSFSIMDFDGANYFTMAGAQGDSLNITMGAEVAAEATTKFIANPYTSATSAPTVFATTSFSTEHLIPAWDTTFSIGGTPSGGSPGTVTGGTSYTNIQDATINIARKTLPIYTMGAQTAYQNFAGPIEVSGKFTAVVSTQSDPFSTGSTAFALTRSPQALVISLTDPNDVTSGTNHSITFQMSSVQFQLVKRLRGKEFTEVEFEYVANGNTNDAVSGYSPLTITTVNNTSTSY